MLKIDENLMNKNIEPVMERNEKIYEQLLMARKDYFSFVVSGGDVANYSVVFPSMLSETINGDLQESPYLMMIRLSITNGISVIDKNLIFQVNDQSRDGVLLRFGHVYQMEILDEYEADDSRALKYALNEGFSLESLYLPEIDPVIGKGAIDQLDNSNDQLNFLYWLGTKIPIIIMVDEISAPRILPAAGTEIPIGENEIKTIASLREKSKNNTYQGINKVKPFLLIPNPKDLKLSTVLIDTYKAAVDRDEMKVPVQDDFRSLVGNIQDNDGKSFLDSNNKLVNFKFAGTTNFIIFTEDEMAINKANVESSHFEVVKMPDFDLRLGYVTNSLYRFQMDEDGVEGFKIVVGDSEDGSLVQLATQLSGLTSRQIREVINKELSVNRALAKQNDESFVRILIANVARSRNKMINNTIGLEVIENDLTFDDVEGLEEIKSYFDLVIEVLQSDPEYHNFLSNILLLGPPGTGKTLTATAAANLATKLGYTGIEFHIDELLGKFVGDTELNTRTALTRLEATERAFVWTDEIDRKLPDTERKSDGGDSGVTNRMATLLMEFWGEDNDMVFVAGSNNPQNMPTATLDRYFIRLCLLPPDRQGRIKLFALKYRQLQKSNSRIKFVPSIDHIAEVSAREIGDVGGRPLENITKMIAMFAMGKSNTDVIINERKIRQLMTSVNVQYGDKQELMVKNALRFANPLNLLNTEGALSIIRYSKSDNPEDRKTFLPLKIKIEKIIKTIESKEDLTGSFLDKVVWDIGLIKAELNLGIKSQTSVVSSKTTKTTKTI